MHCQGAGSKSCFPTLQISFVTQSETLHDVQVKLLTDCLSSCNKLMMSDTHPIKKKKIINITFILDWLWHALFFFSGHSKDSPTHCNDWAFVLILYIHVSSPVMTTVPELCLVENFHQYLNNLTTPGWLWHGSISACLVKRHCTNFTTSAIFQSKLCDKNLYWCQLLQQLHGQ